MSCHVAMQLEDERRKGGTPHTHPMVDVVGLAAALAAKADAEHSHEHNHDDQYAPLDHEHESGSTWEFPVGWLLLSVTDVNPSTFLGYGTWDYFGAGRMLIGRDSEDADFDSIEETGGSKISSALIAHTHVQDAHTHVQNAHNHTQDAHTHNFLPRSSTTGAVSSIVTGTLDTSSAISGANQPHIQSATATNQAATAVNQNATAVNQSAGSGSSFSLMNPYIVVFMWKRVS